MADYEIGYRKPPGATKFKPGESGNPKGRPRRDQSLGNVVDRFLETPIEHLDNGRKRTATRREIELKLLVQQAIKGNVGAAEILLLKRARALRRSDTGLKQLLIRDPLPDYPGQTAAQKARELGSAMDIQVIVVEDASSVVGHPAEAGENLEQSSVTEAVDGTAD